jgi:hypothetical protein
MKMHTSFPGIATSPISSTQLCATDAATLDLSRESFVIGCVLKAD